MQSQGQQQSKNLLIESLPEASRERLKKIAEPVGLPQFAELFKPGEMPRYAYFITSGLASVVLTMSDGMGMEVGVVGVEGITAWLHLLGNLPVQVQCFMQIEGTGLRVSMSELHKEFKADENLHKAILEFSLHQSLVQAQLIACNRKHSVEQRLARWLLMAQQRVGMDRVGLTQEFLAEMLGSRRTSVGVAEGELEDRKLIKSHRGQVTILDEAGLSKAACECYGTMRSLLQDLYQ